MNIYHALSSKVVDSVKNLHTGNIIVNVSYDDKSPQGVHGTGGYKETQKQDISSAYFHFGYSGYRKVISVIYITSGTLYSTTGSVYWAITSII